MLDNREVKSILKYRASRKYFGDLTATALSGAYHILKKSVDWDNPVIESPVYVGIINGNVICDGLWKIMSINPVRYGPVSPFIYNNRNNIYKFCDSKYKDVPDIENIRYLLIQYLTLNSKPNGQWYDEIYTNNGYVKITLENGHTDNIYKALSTLCHCARTIAQQNVSDWSDKRGPYREKIANAIMNIKAQQNQPCTDLNKLHAEYDELAANIARIDNNIETCEINLDLFSPDSPEYQDAINDLNAYQKSLIAPTKRLRQIAKILQHQH